MRILHSSAILGRTSPPKYSQGFSEPPRGGQKTGKNQGFFGCLMCVFFFPFRLLMVTCRLDIPSCLQMCHSSLLSYFCCYVFLLCGGCVSLFLCIFIFVVLFTFHSVVSLCCLLSWCDKTQIKSQNISNFDCHLLLRCLHPHTFDLAQIITLLGQEKNPSKCFFLPCFLVY